MQKQKDRPGKAVGKSGKNNKGSLLPFVLMEIDKTMRKEVIEWINEVIDIIRDPPRCEDADIAIRLLQQAIEALEKPATYKTPDQYKERTGKDWPDNAAVYWSRTISDGRQSTWEPSSYSYAKHFIDGLVNGTLEIKTHIVITTEAGCPPDGWRPE